MNEKLKQILIIISTIAMILINYLATTSQIGGVTPRYISDKYPSFLTPAGYAFSIWGLIYLGMIAFSIYQAIPSNSGKFSKIRSFYILSCFANCSWIFAWHYEYLWLSLFAMLTLLASLIYINLTLPDAENIADKLSVKLPFSIYFGWITVATILNVTILLVSIGVSASEFVSKTLACILIFLATALGVIIHKKLTIVAYPLTIAWALTAIAIKQSGKTAIVLTCAIGVIVLLISALSFVITDDKKLK